MALITCKHSSRACLPSHNMSVINKNKVEQKYMIYICLSLWANWWRADSNPSTEITLSWLVLFFSPFFSNLFGQYLSSNLTSCEYLLWMHACVYCSLSFFFLVIVFVTPMSFLPSLFVLSFNTCSKYILLFPIILINIKIKYHKSNTFCQLHKICRSTTWIFEVIIFD